ncbi:vacuolar protein sorting-associated protein VTA1 homolog [Octopus bimaculoides]|uniref:vacuolar protein sorting-associated protein VTA1 homolog n=1 Tax=Octopus bimaculoides TaxID=37653 RepID=UPI0022E79959|nr:vacuolar protein sorting-associated protein VTA1 homolog [Octopus bimaculoides]
MASGGSPALPPYFKPIQHYLKIAEEHSKRDQVVSYYCQLYAFQKAMGIDKKSPDCRDYLMMLMDSLEMILMVLHCHETPLWIQQTPSSLSRNFSAPPCSVANSHELRSSLDFIPQVFNWIQILAESRPQHGSDVVLMQEVHGDPCRVGGSIVLLEHVAMVTCEEEHDAYRTPNYDALATPHVSFHDTGISVAFTPLTPHPHSAIRGGNAGPALIREDYRPPLFMLPMNLVKTFYTAGLLFDVLSVFGETDEDLEKNKKYAKWKAAYIHKCLKNGETPIAGPMTDENEEEDNINSEPVVFSNINEPGPSGMNQNAATTYPDMGLSANGPSPNQQPDRLQKPPSGSMAPPTTPQDSIYGNNAVSTAGGSSMYTPWKPPENPAGVTLTTQDYQKAMKLCKFASSALQYEDSKTAIENLQKALTLLTTGQQQP